VAFREAVRGLDSESMHRPASSMIVLALALVGLACEEEPTPGFEDGSWATGHREQIENDCDRRVMCEQRTNPHLRADVFEDCVSTTAINLNASEETRFRWSLGVSRCFQEDACQYVACADSTFVSWGESQRLKIENMCMQTRACAVETGRLTVDPQTYYEQCRVDRVRLADMIAADLRMTYTNAYFQCETLVGCAFQMCFPY
jgi:hypothetical protein